MIIYYYIINDYYLLFIYILLNYYLPATGDAALIPVYLLWLALAQYTHTHIHT